MPYQAGNTLSKPILPSPISYATSGNNAAKKSENTNFAEVFRSFQGSSPQEMLTRLSERFSTVSFRTEFTRDAISNSDRNAIHSVQITDGMLKKMANDPNEYKRVTEKIERWLSGATELSETTGGKQQVGMSISEHGTMIWALGVGGDFPDTESEVFTQAWEKFVDALLEWLRNQGESCTFELLDYSKSA